MPESALFLRGISVLIQYALIVFLYYFLYQILRLMRADFGLDSLACHADRTAAKLIILHAEGVSLTFREIPVRGRLTVGRDQGNDVVIDDAYVSHDHAVFWQDGGEYWIEDINSVNHTYVNGILLDENKVLSSGDIIKVGLVTFKFER